MCGLCSSVHCVDTETRKRKFHYRLWNALIYVPLLHIQPLTRYGHTVACFITSLAHSPDSTWWSDLVQVVCGKRSKQDIKNIR